MKSHVLRLAELAALPERHILGLMSGTSMDGLDLAYCRIAGTGVQTRVEVECAETLPYDAAFCGEVRRVFARPVVELSTLALLNVMVAERHAAQVLFFLKKNKIPPESVDLLASHGQTVWHAPARFHGLQNRPNSTLQIGDGDHLARRTGLITVSDFRQKHLAAGGEGAPLALYGDYFLFSKAGEARFLLNVGGIANFSFLPSDMDASKAYATDTGPGNTLMDAVCRRFWGCAYDREALIGSGGRLRADWLERWLRHPFFQAPAPKTTGPEEFTLDWALSSAADGADHPADLLHTLCALTARSIADCIRQAPSDPAPRRILLSGGGLHNPLLRRMLGDLLPDYGLEALNPGFDPDAKEAVLFALLANEAVAGQGLSGRLLGGIPYVGMGKFSFPD
ncbi:MAG: anhydro-N-acetylmuramic acid kinase [Saprospiraceae bacterium]